MNDDPRRLRDEPGSELQRALLAAGASYRGSAQTRAKALAALGLAGSAALTSSAAQAASSSLLSKLGWIKVAAAVSVAGAATVSAGYYLWQHQQVEAPVAAASAPSRALRLAAVAPRSAPEAIEAPQAETPQALVAEAPLPVELPRAGVPRRSAPPAALREPRADALESELAALDRARSALSRGKPAVALSELESYSRAHARGRLRLEADVLRMAALSGLGQRDALRARAQAFLKRYPNSVLAPRVRGYLGE